MYCPGCGSEARADDAFCSTCGGRLREAGRPAARSDAAREPSAAPVVTPEPSAEGPRGAATPAREWSGPKRRRDYAVIGGVVALLVIVGVLLLTMNTRPSRSPDTALKPEEATQAAPSQPLPEQPAGSAAPPLAQPEGPVPPPAGEASPEAGAEPGPGTAEPRQPDATPQPAPPVQPTSPSGTTLPSTAPGPRPYAGPVAGPLGGMRPMPAPRPAPAPTPPPAPAQTPKPTRRDPTQPAYAIPPEPEAPPRKPAAPRVQPRPVPGPGAGDSYEFWFRPLEFVGYIAGFEDLVGEELGTNVITVHVRLDGISRFAQGGTMMTWHGYGPNGELLYAERQPLTPQDAGWLGLVGADPRTLGP